MFEFIRRLFNRTKYPYLHDVVVSRELQDAYTVAALRASKSMTRMEELRNAWVDLASEGELNAVTEARTLAFGYYCEAVDRYERDNSDRKKVWRLMYPKPVYVYDFGYRVVEEVPFPSLPSSNAYKKVKINEEA